MFIELEESRIRRTLRPWRRCWPGAGYAVVGPPRATPQETGSGNATATRWRRRPRNQPSGCLIGVTSHGTSPTVHRRWEGEPEAAHFHVGNECFGVLQEVRLPVRRSPGSRTRTCTEPSLPVRCHPPRYGPPVRGAPGARTRTSTSSAPMNPTPWRKRWLDMLKSTVPNQVALGHY